MSGTYLLEDIEQSQRILADMLRSEYSCVGHFMDSLGPGVSAPGASNAKLLFQAGIRFFNFFLLKHISRPNGKTDNDEQWLVCCRIESATEQSNNM